MHEWFDCYNCAKIFADLRRHLSARKFRQNLMASYTWFVSFALLHSCRQCYRLFMKMWRFCIEHVTFAEREIQILMPIFMQVFLLVHYCIHIKYMLWIHAFCWIWVSFQIHLIPCTTFFGLTLLNFVSKNMLFCWT